MTRPREYDFGRCRRLVEVLFLPFAVVSLQATRRAAATLFLPRTLYREIENYLQSSFAGKTQIFSNFFKKPESFLNPKPRRREMNESKNQNSADRIVAALEKLNQTNLKIWQDHETSFRRLFFLGCGLLGVGVVALLALLAK